jgi:hypothetical protein
MGERFGRFLAAGSAGSLARGIGEATYGADRAAETENLTAKWLMNNRHAPDEATARGMARNPALLKTILSGAQRQPPAAVQEYQFYTQQEASSGRQPLSFNDWSLEKKKAGAISINNQGESEFSKTAGKKGAERFDDLVTQGLKARERRADLKQLADLAPRVGTGLGAQVTAAFGPLAEALGLKIDNLGDVQAYQGIVDRMVPNMRVPGSGATSDFDAKQFLSALPGLGRTPEGNAIINQTMQAVTEMQDRAAEIASRALQGTLPRADAERELRALPDPYDIYKRWKADQPDQRAAEPASPKAGAAKAPAWTDPDTGAIVRRVR